MVYNAARYAVAGASCMLDQEMSVHGVRVITIHTKSVPSEKLFVVPKIPRYIDTFIPIFVEYTCHKSCFVCAVSIMITVTNSRYLLLNRR